jgi:DNA-binding transcriptional ArsR family regulator
VYAAAQRDTFLTVAKLRDCETNRHRNSDSSEFEADCYTLATLRSAMKKKPLSNGEYESQALIFKALSNPVRLHLLELLCRKQRWAGELQENLGISKANLSQHLSVLRAAGVVATQREGKQLYCGIALPEVKTATTTLRHMTKAVTRAGRR